MPYLVANLTPGAARSAVSINFGQEGISRVRVHSYQAAGLTSLSPIFLKIHNQPTSPIYGNTGSLGFPLVVPSAPDAAVQYNVPPVLVEGDNVWNNSHQLEIELLDINNNPVVFSVFLVVFELLTRDPFTMREQPPPDFSLYKEAFQRSTRNIAQLPGAFYSHWGAS